MYESGKFIKNISINPFKQNYFLTNFNNKTIDSHCFLIEFSQLLSNTSLLESTENTHNFLNVLLYHKPQELLKLKNIDILVSKIISAVHRKSNDSDIALARQFLNGFDSISAKNITTFDIELYNFILCYPQINREFVNKYLDYIKDNFNNIKARRFLVKYLSCNFEFNDFVLICESDLFEINELFQIVVKRFDLNLTKLNEKLNQKDFIDWINLLITKDEDFFRTNISNTSSLLRFFIADYFKVTNNNVSTSSLSAINKILINCYYKSSGSLNVKYEYVDILESLSNEKDNSYRLRLHKLLTSNELITDNILLDLVFESSHYHDVILMLYIAGHHSAKVTIQRCYRVLKNYVRDAEDLVSLIT